jgi:ribonuclease R
MITAEDVLSFFSGPRGRPCKRRELARELGVDNREYTAFRGVIRELIKSGRVVKLKRGRLAPPDPLNLVVGTVSLKPQGFAFVHVEDRPDLPEVFVKARRTTTALDGDRVMVRLLPLADGPTPEGEIIRVIERADKPLPGIFGKTKFISYVRPTPPSPITEIYIYPDRTKKARPGQQVLVRIDEWPAADLTPEGHVTKVLGFPDEPGVDIQRVIHEHNLPLNFPRRVLAEVRTLPAEITAGELEGRRDFRETITFTIDPEDAKDFDDAVSLEETLDGWRIGVHIADVAHYVRPETALDRDAYERGTSVYLVDRVVPMLPTRLSNDLCSLKPKVDRLTMSCLAEITRDGEVRNFELFNSVIHSRARLNYKQVMQFFVTGEPGRIPAAVADKLTIMRRAAGALRDRRFKLGSLNLELPEVKVILDPQGVPVRIEQETGDESHWVIEDLMLMANQCVAAYFLRKTAPLLYRIHAAPEREKIEEFAGFVQQLGYRFSPKGGLTTRKLGRLLDQFAADPRRHMIYMLLLRSLKKAEYAPDNVGHFGLGFSHYCHFTSPIRRYPDLWVHRHLKLLLAGQLSVTQKKRAHGDLPAIGRWTSERERAAMEAERESVRIKQMQYLGNHLGDEYQGVISGFLDFGFFVTLDDVWLDGLVRFSGIDDDYYAYNPERFKVTGRRRNRTFSLGDQVRVRVIKVDMERRQVDLIMADAPLEQSTRRRWSRQGR